MELEWGLKVRWQESISILFLILMVVLWLWRRMSLLAGNVHQSIGGRCGATYWQLTLKWLKKKFWVLPMQIFSEFEIVSPEKKKKVKKRLLFGETLDGFPGQGFPWHCYCVNIILGVL